jgi:PfaD family protein
VTVTQHLDTLSAYEAGAVRLALVEGEPELMLGEGGGLEDRYETLGRGPLLEVLRDPAVLSITLADGALEIEAVRDAGGARLAVRYDAQVITSEPMEIPPLRATIRGPAFRPDRRAHVSDPAARLRDPASALWFVEDDLGRVQAYTAGLHGAGVGERPLVGAVPPVDPSELGSAAWRRDHGARWAIMAGAMAGGIASVDLVAAMAEAGLFAMFGAGGLPIEAVERSVAGLAARLGHRENWGCNLLHNPNEPDVEERTVDLYLAHGVRHVSASAYMDLTPAVVRYRLSGLTAGPDGRPLCRQRVIAKVSRPEVAEKFLRPAPSSLLNELVQRGALTAAQAELARKVPIAQDITVEADSGGHTDHRPLLVQLPLLMALRDRIAREEGTEPARIGAAGGIGTPASAFAAFAMGADYVLTGSINQATVEAGTSDVAKRMLLEASFTDVATGPAPDMFEIGAHVQVLSRGSMYARRAEQLYELYRAYPSMDAIPAKDREKVEKQIMRRPLAEVWEGTREYWATRDPRQVERAEQDPRHKMALTFRWYLGMTSRWARMGDEDRKRDFQIWCGPAMGAFNAWVAGTWLEPLEARTVVHVNAALMLGAAAHARIQAARLAKVPLPPGIDAVPVPDRDHVVAALQG